MSDRPRRSAAQTSSKAWAALMPKSERDEAEDFVEEAIPEQPKSGVKRSASKEEAHTPGIRGRKKKAKVSESGASESADQASPNESLATPKDNKPVKSEPKSSPRSPKKQLPPTPKILNKPVSKPVVPTQGSDNVEKMYQDFDRHQADLAGKLEEGDMEGEEEIAPPERPVTKVPAKTRGRPSTKQAPPPAMMGMDDPNDEDYSIDADIKPAKKRPSTSRPPRPAPVHHQHLQISPPMRNPAQPQFRVSAGPPRPQTVVIRPGAAPTRVVFQNHRFPSVVNGGPRVVQPRYIQPSRNINPASLRQPVNPNQYDTPLSLLKDIEKLTEDCKQASSPEVASAFQLIELLREEMERMQQHIRDSNTYYKTFIEDLQAAAQSQFDSSQNRINSLENRLGLMDAQLKKAAAVAHQKLLKTALEGFRDQQQPPQTVMSPPKVVPQFIMMEGEGSSMEQMQPRDYLVQEEDYQGNHPDNYYSQDAVIQEASKEVDSML